MGAYTPAVPLIASLKQSPSRSRALRGAADSCQSCNIAEASIITMVLCHRHACLPVWAPTANSRGLITVPFGLGTNKKLGDCSPLAERK